MSYEIQFDVYHDGRTLEVQSGYPTRQDAEDDVERLIDLIPRWADAKVRIVKEGR